MGTTWALSDLAESKGKHELFLKQAPEKLEALREHAIIESALSSNRIEGVEIDPKRVRAVMAGHAALRDRNEEEVRGYRDALKLIHESSSRLEVSERTILRLHKLTRGHAWDAGQYKQKDVDIVETFPNGGSRIRFKTVSAKQTPKAMNDLMKDWEGVRAAQSVHPLISLAAFNLDFLCIHPFRDGNGRASRLLMLLQCYQVGYEVGRYISIERVIEQNKDRYYETLQQASQGWHDDKNDPWPYINYCLYVLRNAHREFEERVGDVAAPRGAKTDLVMSAIRGIHGEFRIGELQRMCPGVSVDMIRRVLKDLQSERKVRCLGRGRDAAWKKAGRWN